MLESELAGIVTFNPTVVEPATRVAELLCQWVRGDFHHWPVVDEDQRLMGMVSEQDITQMIDQLAAECATDTERAAQLHTKTAGQIMTTPLVTVSRWDSQLSGLYYLLKNRIHALPVLDQDRLIGLVTTTDYLREFSYGEFPICRHPVSDWVQEGTEPIDCDASLDEVAVAMSQAGIDQIGVVNGTLPLGVICSRDLRLAKCRLACRRLLGQEFMNSGPTTLRELVAKSPTLPPGARLSEAANLMVEHHRRVVAVVTQAGRFIGVLSEDIVLGAMAGQRPAVAM